MRCTVQCRVSVDFRQIRNAFHLIRHGSAVTPSPQGEGFRMRQILVCRGVEPEQKSISERKGALLYTPVGRIARSGALHPTPAEENLAASLCSVKAAASPLAPLKRRSPVNLPPAGLHDVQKKILRMIAAIRRIHCFLNAARWGGFFMPGAGPGDGYRFFSARVSQ